MQMRGHILSVSVVLVLAFAASRSNAQVTTGMPPFGSFSGGPDHVNNANLNIHYTIPVMQKAGRGIPFVYDLGYDSSIWQPVPSGSTKVWLPASAWGWSSGIAAVEQYVLYTLTYTSGNCGTQGHYQKWTYGNFIYFDITGTSHTFPGNPVAWYYSISGGILGLQGCPSPGASNPSGSTLQIDGFTMKLSAAGAGFISLNSLEYLDGTTFLVPLVTSPPGSTGNTRITDRNGNYISSSNGVYTDTLGATALTVAEVNGTTQLTYTPPSGQPDGYTIYYSTYTVMTNFQCNGVSEFGPTSESLVSEITLPDATYYQFTYEATPGHPGDITGRLASVTLPTGGVISYNYTGGSNGIECADGSTAGLQRYTPDTGSTTYWNYSRTLGTGGGPNTTTLTDPQNDQTTFYFQGIYETERQINQDINGNQTTLETVYTCYNGSTPPCNSGNVNPPPFTQRSVTVQLPANNLESRAVTFYNTFGLATELDEYGYNSGGVGPLLRKTLTSYATLGNGIFNMPASVTLCSPTGNSSSCGGTGTVVAQTIYCYDEATPSGSTSCGTTGSPTPTSGTPNHVTISGSRGNATTINFLVSGSTYLNRRATYYDTGTINVATDTNGGTTTPTYGTGSCGNAFPTSITEAVSGLSTSLTWDCTGGVETSVTDENGKTVSYGYTPDPWFWRLHLVTDKMGNQTNISYTRQSSTESVLSFANQTGNSTIDTLTTFDPLGRVQIVQERQQPSPYANFDSVETDYDTLGRPDRVTLPYTGTAGQLNSNAPSKTVTYDALDRQTGLQDSPSAGQQIAFSYTGNDVYRSWGPAPSGENSKNVQNEYDALGRLTSVCEITAGTSMWPGGACGQNNPATGYLTDYSYDVLNDLTSVTQNAQSSSTQLREYWYDGVRRLIQELNAETGNGMTVYTWDSDSTCGTSLGDLVKKQDPVGDATCNTYDAMHRLTSTYALSGPYASVTPYKYFIYDSATVNGSSLYNIKARLAEAYTSSSACPSPCSSQITDEGFSYDARGELSDLYESTPHSAGYYHTVATYWPNGVPNEIYVPGGYSVSFNVDGEGRTYSNGTTLTSTVYNPAGQPTQVNFGSGDSDSYTYDANFRMTQYTFNVGAQSVVGSLAWNANGSLGQLTINDPFNSADSQTCKYGDPNATPPAAGYDDLGRLISATCTGGSTFSGVYSYDAFGNLTKSGTYTFQPSYNSATNQMSSIGGQIPAYDLNGNVEDDYLNTYSWDANGRPVIVNGVGITYDAFDRMVEQDRSGMYTEMEYSPTGYKMEAKNGQARVASWVPLTGGAVAVYNASSFIYYQHGDWLGSGRFASTGSQTMYYDQAVGPFGEPYAQAGTPVPNFTGKNQDTASNVYDFPAREYGIQGRWPSPDPAGLAAVNPMDPQTWNRYAYVRNSPLEFVDPQGLRCLIWEWVSLEEFGYWYCLLDGNGGIGGGTAKGSPKHKPPTLKNQCPDGQAPMQVNPAGNTLLQVGGQYGFGGAAITYAPGTGQVYGTMSAAAPKAVGVSVLAGSGELSGTNVVTVTGSGFVGIGGALSTDVNTGQTTLMEGFNVGPPGGGISADVSNPIGKLPPATMSVCVNQAPQGVPTYPIGDGLVTWDEIPNSVLNPQ